MFYIYWMNKNNRDWVGDEGFETRADAVKFLKEQGYSLQSGWFRRKQVGWEGETRALIGRLKLHANG